MPIVTLNQTHPLADGRQSENAMLVRRGVQRLFLEMGLAVLPELPLASGRRADLAALTKSGDIWIVEIKSSIEDWKADRKWPDYRLHCDRLFLATHPGVPRDIFPEECGLILSDGYGAEILRDAPEHRLAAATRKAMTLRFARIGASRLTLAELAGLVMPEDVGE
ncbi:MmcB family DNA repair protein [Brucella sp. IR073]|uniref:MmcB family DNA repair protein n=1 Tax=unclassified Brucella TaxID=2632610 RepID=UPI003B98596E